VLFACIAAPTVRAEEKKSYGNVFAYGDWELVCDNTKRCHAIGYYSAKADDASLVSIMLSRDAGANTKVSAQLSIGDDAFKGESGKLVSKSLDPSIPLTRLEYAKKTKIRDSEVTRLIASVLKDKELTINTPKREATISLEGASAVLLKMDEWQGRLDTPGALVKKGDKPESI
jgi:hypothetical protein